MRDDCKRFTAEPNLEWQSWFAQEPFTIEDDYFECVMYWGGNSESIMQDLKEIFNKDR